MEDIRSLKNIDAADGSKSHSHYLWDVRTMDEFEGKVTLPGAFKPGRIPWTSGRIDWFLFREKEETKRSSSSSIQVTGKWKTCTEIRQLAEEYLDIVFEDENDDDRKYF